MSDQLPGQPQDTNANTIHPATVEAECPHCHHKFLHKVEGVFVKVLETGAVIVGTNLGAIGGDK
jgi:hypothetical protein